MGIGDNGSALCHPVSNSVREVDIPEEFLDVLIEGSSTHDNFDEVVSEGADKLCTYLLTDHIIEARNPEHCLDAALLTS